MSGSLLISTDRRLRRLTLNRPEKRNALNVALCRSLIQAIGEANEDRAIGAILLDAGGKDFCSGMDLSEALETDPEQTLALHQELFSIGARLRKPMVSAVHGAALAGGLGLALNAHVVVAASDARFGLTELRVGLWPYMIFRAVAAAAGERKAMELALTARILDAEEARRIGLVDLIVEPECLREEAGCIASEMAEGSAEAITEGLAFVQQTQAGGYDTPAAAFRRKAWASADFREGILAFREKRKPKWPSHTT